MARRDGLTILASILDVCREGSKKTHIVYKCNLNFKIILPKLKKLIDDGRLIKIDTDQYPDYIVTKKGLEWLRKYQDLF